MTGNPAAAARVRSGGRSWGWHWRRVAARLGDPPAARVLVEEASGQPAAQWLGDDGAPATEAGAARLEELLARLEGGEPLQYVIGHWGFRTLDLCVGPGVLVPRPETEFVVEVALGELRRLGGRRVADLGTGSGAIGLAIAVEMPASEVLAADRSPDALAIARANLARTGGDVQARVRFFEGDWYAALPPEVAGLVDLVVSNPPYVAEAEWAALDPVVRDHEPHGALVAGPAGTEAIEAVVAGAPRWLRAAGAVVVEIAPGQRVAALALAHAAGFGEAEVLADLAGRDRVLVARR